MFQTTLFRREKQTRMSLIERRNELLLSIRQRPQHQWIESFPKILLSIEFIVNAFDHQKLDQFEKELKNIILINGSGSFSITAHASDIHYIILQADAIDTLCTNSPTKGAAILAHEIGHILSGHTIDDARTQKGQMEADAFAASLGLGNELQDILLEHKSADELSHRINHLTIILSKSEL